MLKQRGNYACAISLRKHEKEMQKQASGLRGADFVVDKEGLNIYYINIYRSSVFVYSFIMFFMQSFASQSFFLDFRFVISDTTTKHVNVTAVYMKLIGGHPKIKICLINGL